MKIKIEDDDNIKGRWYTRHRGETFRVVDYDEDSPDIKVITVGTSTAYVDKIHCTVVDEDQELRDMCADNDIHIGESEISMYNYKYSSGTSNDKIYIDMNGNLRLPFCLPSEIDRFMLAILAFKTFCMGDTDETT